MKKQIFLVLIFFSLIPTVNSQSKERIEKNEIVVSGFHQILDSLNIKGAILIYDFDKGKYYSNNFGWAKAGYLPASTFKIPNSIIALETGVIQNDSVIFRWNGKKRALKEWERDLTFKQAFKVSCVPCYQEVARKIGMKRMNFYLKKLNYNKMVFDAKTIDNFWLRGKSKISQMDQINFLKRLYFSELPISKRTESVLKDIMIIEKKDNYIFSGKTGWGQNDAIDNGWVVGYLEIHKKVYFFATNVEPNEGFDLDGFAAVRINSTKEAFRKLKILE